MSVASNESSSGREALEVALHQIAEHTGWPVGHIYSVEDDGRHLVPLTSWAHPDDERLLPFRRGDAEQQLRVGRRPARRALAAKAPCWITDVTTDDNFPRRDAARAGGLAAAFAFPVLVGSEVTAVLEFFAAEPLQADEALCEVMGQTAPSSAAWSSARRPRPS